MVYVEERCWINLEWILELLREGVARTNTNNAMPIELHVSNIDVVTAQEVEKTWRSLKELVES